MKTVLFLLLTVCLEFPALVLGQVQPPVATLGSFQQQQFTLPGYSGVNWSMSPPFGMGTINSAGVYTAPDLSMLQGPPTAYIYARPQGGGIFVAMVTLSSDTSQQITIPITLPPPAPVTTPVPTPEPPSNPVSVPSPNSKSISLTPSYISLMPSGSAVLAVNVQGVSSPIVVWSLNPNIGTLSNGIYTAPYAVAGDTQVTISATSIIDSSLTATATVMLVQPVTPVSISLSGGAATLSAGQSTQFIASVYGAANSSVSWSVSPSLGTINNGVYTAPTGITSQQVVTITATSLSDPTKTASASLIVEPVADPPAENISISLSPESTSRDGGQSAVFTPTVSGTSNTSVIWSLNPEIGTITGGVYQAPAVVASAETVTITATSAADSSKTASATVSLIPVSIGVSPGSASLEVGQSASFNATVSGSSNTGVSWSLNPAVGTITGGVYQAPANITSAQTVTITATSAADSTKTATATVWLAPVGISMSPGSVSLAGGQTASFSATISGNSNTSVTWSLSPAVGTITGGLYQAPATIASAQTVTVTATSVADSAKTATATVTLVPTVVTVAPASVSLAAGKSATFSASVTGATNTAVTWSLSPSAGTIVNGVYTAPASITAAQVVTVTASSVANTAKTATAIVSLVPTATTSASTTPSVTTVTLPVEVMGPNGTTASASVNVPSGANVSGPLNLWMQIHGLKFDSEASVQVNSSAWMPLSTGNVTLLGNAAAFGGIGGGFHTLQMTLSLPAGVVVAGNNTVTFRFNGTDGVVSGFRILAFNIQSGGTNLIPSSQFVEDDPSTWQPPSTAASDIAAGQALYQGAPLTTPNGPIQAHCSDCHTVDGRDLKYFNYSNHSIEVRSAFHGLTAQQGAQIASYIRSLNVPNPGRPWNPPYQPGPGLDSQPVTNWAAGAGLDAVLANDSEMLPYLTPGGSTAGWAATSYLNPRELPVVLQLPDWNSWLPVVHPMDAFGSAFEASGLDTYYLMIRAALQPNSPTAYAQGVQYFPYFLTATGTLLGPVENNATNTNTWDQTLRTNVYSVALWQMVKMWELNQEFGLEGMPQVPFGANADLRGWDGNAAFFTSPNMLHIPAGPGLGNGSTVTQSYLSFIWYQVQLILNDGQGQEIGTAPIDYGYVSGMLKNLFAVNTGLPGIMLELAWKVKSLQEYTLSGPPLYTVNGQGWSPVASSPEALVDSSWMPLWSATSPATQTSLLQAYTQAWFNQASQYKTQQWYQSLWATATDNPATLFYETTFGGELWYEIPRLKMLGVDQTLLSQMSAWGATIWPTGNWSSDLAATCSSVTECTSGY